MREVNFEEIAPQSEYITCWTKSNQNHLHHAKLHIKLSQIIIQRGETTKENLGELVNVKDL